MGHYGTWSHRVTSHHGAASQPPGHRLRLRPCPCHPGQQEDHGGQGGQAQRTAEEGWVTSNFPTIFYIYYPLSTQPTSQQQTNIYKDISIQINIFLF